MTLLHHRSEPATASAAPWKHGADGSLLERSSLYREFLAEREEIHKLKWLESEKAGRDIGLDCARACWVTRHRALWRKARHQVLMGLN